VAHRADHQRYGERGGDMKFGQRFRYNNLSQTYAKYKIFSARSSSRKKKEKCSAISVPPPKPSKQSAPRPRRLRNQQRPSTTPVSAAPQPTSFRMVCSEPDNETDKVDQLYQAFQQAMQQTGGAVRQSRDNFADFVSKKTKELQTQKNCAKWNTSWKSSTAK